MTINWNGPRIEFLIRSATLRGVLRGTEAVREEATSLILDGPKTGRVYQRRGVKHQASAPGEAPASDTGNLVRNIQTEIDTNNLVGRVNFGTEYAAALEFGTEKMEARPFARPALANKVGEIYSTTMDEVRKVLK